MSIIQKAQKEVLIEEASKRALKISKPEQVFDIFKELIGVSDYDQQAAYGLPLAPGYKAVAGKPIDIDKIKGYVQGIFRDLQVSIQAATELEDQFALAIGEYWYDVEALKNKASNIIASANDEKNRLDGTTTWVFTETFKNIFYVDNNLSTAWIDTGEGIVFLPMSQDTPVTSDELRIVNVTFNDPGGFLGSTPAQAFDGLDSSNWRMLITRPNSKAIIEIEFLTPQNISSVTFDPIGFGVNTQVEVLQDKGYQQYTKQVFYSKTTVPQPIPQARRFRFTLTTPETALPKTIGFRGITFHRSNPAKTASLFSKVLTPQFSYNALKLDMLAKLPANTQIDAYYSADQLLWKKAALGSWISLIDDSTQKIEFDLGDLTSFGVLYQTPLFTKIPISENDGQLEVGTKQLEIAAVRFSSAEVGDMQYNPSPKDFDTKFVKKAWGSMVIKADAQVGSAVTLNLQLKSDNTAHPILNRGKQLIAPQNIGETYTAMTLLPIGGTSSDRCCQPNYIYRFQYNVYLDADKYFESGRFWFLQGFRAAGQRSYAEIGTTYGTFALYINDIKVTGSDQPRTLYNDGSCESGTTTGESFSFTLNKGWNKIQLFVYCPEDPKLNSDPYSSSDPYLQLTLYPNIFDTKFIIDYGVTKILGSGQFKPIPEFDLMWHVPKDVQYWSWPTNDDRIYALLNVGSVDPIDGYYGQVNQDIALPNCTLTFQGHTNDSHGGSTNTIPLYLRFDLGRSDKVQATPLLEGYTLTTK